MFKTNSRKGLSLASIAALTASLFVGVLPAQAADVALVPNVGTTTNAISGETFTLKATAGVGTTGADWQTLKFRLANAANATFSAVVSADGGTTATSTSQTVSAHVAGAGSTTSRNATIALTTATTTSDVVFTVQAWLDIDGSGTINGNEAPSAIVTVNYWALEDITFTTAITPVVLGAGKVAATVVNDKNLNLEQASWSYAVGFGTATASNVVTALTDSTYSTDKFTGGTAATLSTDKLSLKAERAVTIEAEKTYIAQALYNGVEIGSSVTSVVGAAPVSEFSAATVAASVNVKDGNIRTGTTEVTVTSTVSKSNTVLAAEGTVISVEVAESGADKLATTSSIVGGGKTLTNSTSASVQKITFDVAVGAKGKVSVPLTLSLKKDDQFTVKLINGDISTSVTLTVADTAPAEIKDLNVFGDGAVLRVATGSSFNLTYGVLDNFGQPLSGSDYRVTLTNNASTATLSQAITGGKVTFAVTDSSTKTETPYKATLEAFSKATNNYVAVGTSATSVSTTVTPATLPAVSAVTVAVSTTSAYALNTGEHFAADTRVGEVAPEFEVDSATATLSGQVTAANGLGTYAAVTLAAPDAMFEVGGVYTLGSITVQTNATGAYGNVKVYMQKAGKVSVSATVGAVTKDVAVTFAAAAESAAIELVLTAPATVVPGSTFQVKGKLTDKYGNPVKVSSSGILAVKYTGPGFVTGTLPTQTDKDGEFMFSVLLGSGDTGTANVTVAYDGDATATTTTDNIAKAASITIAAPVVVVPEVNAVIGSFNGRWAVRVENAKGAVVSVKVGGNWFKYTSLNENYLFSRKSVVGRSVAVAVYVNGTLENVATITIK